MRFASLGSGSEGNALLVQAGATCIMLDCGFGIAETVLRLARLGLSPEDVDAILITHEHEDHSGGVARFSGKFGIPVWMSCGSWRMLGDEFGAVTVNRIEGQQRFHIGDIDLTPYTVPHDAREPLQFVFGDGARRLGVLTDAGSITSRIRSVLDGCDALVLECNHDLEMLRNGRYPPSLKQRISSRLGHLANDEAAGLLSDIECGRLQHIVAAHLSRQNNTPDLARAALAGALNCALEWIGVADQDGGLDWREIG
ncbi:MAG: MBL fold metallo-hydrolase [Pseudomonadota bacterium]